MLRLRIFCLLVGLTLAAARPGAATPEQGETQNRIDSLEKAVASAKNDAARAESLCALCWELRVAGRTEESLKKGAQGLKLARKAGDPMTEVQCLGSIAAARANQNDYAKALADSRKSLALCKKIGFQVGVCQTLNSMGTFFQHVGDYPSALEHYQRSLRLSKSIGHDVGVAYALTNIGYLQQAKGEYAAAGEALRESMTFHRKSGDDVALSAALSNLAVNCWSAGQYANALEYAREGLRLARKTGHKSNEAFALQTIGELYALKGDLAAAETFYKKSRAQYQAIGDRRGVAGALIREAGLLIALKKPGTARQKAGQALRLAQQSGALEQLKDAALQLARADSALGNYLAAYKGRLRYEQYSDSLENADRAKEIGRLEARYEFDQEIAARKRAESRAAERRRAHLLIAAAAIAALLLVVGLLAWGLATKRRANKLLAERNEEISLQNDRLDAAVAQLRELDQFKESMTGLLVHDLKNSLGVVFSYAEQNREDGAQLKAAARQMNALALNMLDVQKFESADAQLDIRPVSARRAAAAAVEETAFFAAEKHIALRNEIQDDLFLLADEAHLARVLFNLLNNAVKFTPSGGIVRISARSLDEDLAELKVSDTGPGVPPDQLERVFEKYAKLEDPAGANRTGTGLGLAFCKLAAEAHGGAIRAENAPEGGAVFVLTLPRTDAPVEKAFPSPENEQERRPKLAPEDKAALAPVASAMRRHQIYEISEIATALESVQHLASEAAAEWRRKAEHALYTLNQDALEELLREVEA